MHVIEKRWLGKKLNLVSCDVLYRHQNYPLGQLGKSSWMMHGIPVVCALIPLQLSLFVLAGCTAGFL